MELFYAILIGIGLSISTGFRIFTPMLIASIAGKLGWLPLSEGFEWISSTEALIAFVIALVLEVACNYIPFVDNALKVISTPLALVAGTLLTVSVIGVDDTPFLAWGLAIIAGGGTATVSQLTSATFRSASTVSTAGLANPIISFIEDVLAAIVSFLSIVLPILVIIFFAIILFVFLKIMTKIKGRRDSY